MSAKFVDIHDSVRNIYSIFLEYAILCIRFWWSESWSFVLVLQARHCPFSNLRCCLWSRLVRLTPYLAASSACIPPKAVNQAVCLSSRGLHPAGCCVPDILSCKYTCPIFSSTVTSPCQLNILRKPIKKANSPLISSVDKGPIRCRIARQTKVYSH
jgi:hypothetical protein